MDKIAYGKFVQLAYGIFVVSEKGDISVYKFTAERPDSFVFGNDLAMIEGFLRGLEGLEQGSEFDFTLTPAEAFGDRNEDLVIQVPCYKFNIDGEFDSDRVFVGAHVPMQTEDGMHMLGLVKAIDKENVTLDFNHQLAGKHVRYAGRVLMVRDATPEELAPKHGCGCGCDHDGCGHDHGGCNCDGCGGC
ncbi:MAG: FKBP-type peptidyl-prolyl cis-trans isomerase [Muribaculaceae bacterium]|nr:FKBP-type peptidyl-prolyl cis-trans isomerase [Muribaculaceae bacterium]